MWWRRLGRHHCKVKKPSFSEKTHKRSIPVNTYKLNIIPPSCPGSLYGDLPLLRTDFNISTPPRPNLECALQGGSIFSRGFETIPIVLFPKCFSS